MSVIFCGTTALWLWRSGVEFDEPLDTSCAQETLDQADTCLREIRYARWTINELLGAYWDGSEIPNVLAKAPLAKTSFGTRKRQARTMHPGDLVPIRGANEIFVTSPSYSLNQIATEIGVERSALIMNELCGTFRCSNNTNADARMNANPCTSKTEMTAFVPRACRTYRKALELAVDGCASPIEARLFILFTSSIRSGGYAFDPPLVNKMINLDQAAHKVTRLKSVKPDFLWKDRKLVIEYDSTRYHFDNVNDIKRGKIQDSKRAEALKLMGYNVRSMTAQTLFEWTAFIEYMDNIREELCVPAQKLSRNMQKAREDLYMLLIRGTDPLGFGYTY